LDLLTILVITTFIITAVFVGYHASQEPHEEIAESHGDPSELNTFEKQAHQVTLLRITDQSNSI